jgi:elongation factor Ts
MAVSAQDVKQLREKTGVGMMECKKALEEAGGDPEKARMILREKGLARARTKSGRQTAEGIVAAYVHGHGRIGVLVELACETDFVARNEEFRHLAKEIAMQVSAMSPQAVSPEDVPPEVLQAERALYLQQCADKPEHVRERIVQGKLQQFYEDYCLLRQRYIRDESMTVEQVVQQAIAKLGENIEVRRFVRMELGEDS